jgi:pyruvate ferredoxin oxidoreductase gamma subunit
MTEIVWHARGGQGAFTAARILGMAAALFADKFALSFPTFGPERRGAPVLGFTKIDDQRIADRSEIEIADFRVYLDETLLDVNNQDDIKENGIVLVNTASGIHATGFGVQVVGIDATRLALEILGKPIANTALLGALAAVWDGTKIEALQQAITLEMKPSLVDKNVALLYEAYTTIRAEMT